MPQSAIVTFVEELVAQGLASEDQCAQAVQAHRTAGGSFVEHLTLAGVDERALLLPLCTALELVPASASAVRQPEPKLSNIFEHRLADRLLIVAYQLGADRTLHVACADPFLLHALPDDLPPFTLRAACLSDIRAGVDAHLNIDHDTATAPDTLHGSVSHPSAAAAHASPALQSSEASASAVPDVYGTYDEEPTEAMAAAPGPSTPAPQAFARGSSTLDDDRPASAHDDESV